MEAAFGGAPQLATSAHIFHGVRAIRRIAPEFSRTLMDTWSPERRFGLEGVGDSSGRAGGRRRRRRRSSRRRRPATRPRRHGAGPFAEGGGPSRPPAATGRGRPDAWFTSNGGSNLTFLAEEVGFKNPVAQGAVPTAVGFYRFIRNLMRKAFGGRLNLQRVREHRIRKKDRTPAGWPPTRTRNSVHALNVAQRLALLKVYRTSR